MLKCYLSEHDIDMLTNHFHLSEDKFESANRNENSGRKTKKFKKK